MKRGSKEGRNRGSVRKEGWKDVRWREEGRRE